jgi:hypothetical protein
MTTEEYYEFVDVTIPCALFHVDHDDIDDDTGGKLEEVILVRLIAKNPGCLAYNDLAWYFDKFITGYLRAVENYTKSIIPEDRIFGYGFEPGDLIEFDDKFISGGFLIGEFPSMRMIKPKDYKNRVGTVLECTSDLHSFGAGSSYSCKVDFDGDVFSTLAGYFVKADSKKDDI